MCFQPSVLTLISGGMGIIKAVSLAAAVLLLLVQNLYLLQLPLLETLSPYKAMLAGKDWPRRVMDPTSDAL
jgi:hypothetical protein